MGTRQDRRHLPAAASFAILPAALLWLELVFATSTTGLAAASLPAIVLFAVAAGLVLDLACALVPKPRARAVARTLLLALLGLVFCVEHFVYQQFKVLYSPLTVLLGAGDVAGQFAGAAARLVLAPSGLLPVAAYLLPAAACAYVCRQASPERHPARDRRLYAAGTCLALATHLLAVAYVLASPTADLYGSQYSFQTAVPSFGLVASLRKELQAELSGAGPRFSDATPAEDQQGAPTPDQQQATSAKKRKKRRPATLDIDFDALAANTDNDTWAELDRYVASLTPGKTNRYTGLFKGCNLIFVSAEAFSAEAIRPDITPTLFQLWSEGIQLSDYYQFDTAGTTGGECANLFGLLATEGGSSVKMTADHKNALTLGSLLDAQGYEGWAFHNNSYTYYDRDKTHNNLGYSHGFMGYGNGMERWVGWQWPQSDLEMVAGTFDNLYGSLGDKSHPFNVYYMSVSGHSDYDPGENMMAQKNWDVVAGLPYSDRVKGYLAANVELDRAMEYLLGRLRERGIYRRTVIVIAADHFPYGLDQDGALGQLPYLSELYGYDVTNVFERDHNAPIIWCGRLPKRGIELRVDEPTMSIDLLPTLCNLFGLPWDSRLLPGRDVLDATTEGLAFDLSYDWRSELGTYWAATGSFEPAAGAEVPEGYVEAHKALVANKIAYCHGVLTSDYYRHVFSEDTAS